MSELSKLKWQCRRGIKELDIVLIHYLEQDYPEADRQEQTAFKQLLELEDPVLFNLLLKNPIFDNHSSLQSFLQSQ